MPARSAAQLVRTAIDCLKSAKPRGGKRTPNLKHARDRLVALTEKLADKGRSDASKDWLGMILDLSSSIAMAMEEAKRPAG